MAGPAGSVLYRRTVVAAALYGVYALFSGDEPVMIPTEVRGSVGVPIWLRREDADAGASELRRSPGERPRLLRTGRIVDEFLPELAGKRTVLLIMGGTPEPVSAQRLLDDLARYVKPRRRSTRGRVRLPPGLGFQMLDTFDSDRLAPALKARGFSKSGHRWFLRGNGVWGIVWLQRSSANHGDTCSVTVNLDIASDRLQFFQSGSASVGRPDAAALCGEHARLGELLPQRSDTWWEFSPNCDLDVLERELESAILGPGLAFLRQLRSDEALRDRWLLQGASAGIRAVNLAALLHDLGPRDSLPALIDSIRADARARRWDYANALLDRITRQDRSSLDQARP
jgi:hypothetical protein